ncbi:hypothetical protein C8J57DRAFT_1537575 [Mycena rebaudengoi]|nr:hypothetical protein C8J57DRAFT_1537575 [Mycena rebaudengoi]
MSSPLYITALRVSTLLHPPWLVATVGTFQQSRSEILAQLRALAIYQQRSTDVGTMKQRHGSGLEVKTAPQLAKNGKRLFKSEPPSGQDPPAHPVCMVAPSTTPPRIQTENSRQVVPQTLSAARERISIPRFHQTRCTEFFPDILQCRGVATRA